MQWVHQCGGVGSALQLNQSSAGPHAVQWHGHNVASGSIFGGDATLGCLVSKAHSVEQGTWLYFTISALLLCRLDHSSSSLTKMVVRALLEAAKCSPFIEDRLTGETLTNGLGLSSASR